MQESKRSFVGSHISECCKQLIQESKELNTEIFFKFNGVLLIANQDSDSKKLVDYFEKEMKKQELKYKSSEEYESKLLLDQSEIVINQISLENELENLNLLDFNNYEMVLDWFCRVQDLTDRVGVQFDKSIIIIKFEEHGYYIGENTGDSFKENDEDNVAHYIVGQCLSFLDTMGSIHQVVHGFTAQWKRKFK